MTGCVSRTRSCQTGTCITHDAHMLTGMLAPDGRCKTLDASADGYVRAENCIVMVLQPAVGVDSTACGLLAASAVGQVHSQQMPDVQCVNQKQSLCATHAGRTAKLSKHCCKGCNKV